VICAIGKTFGVDEHKDKLNKVKVIVDKSS
jgi:hypothetical protein